MATSPSLFYQTIFANWAKLAYQGTGKLRNVVRQQVSAAQNATFFQMNSFELSDRGNLGSALPAANQTGNKVVTDVHWWASQYPLAREIQNGTISFDLLLYVTQNMMYAQQRREDRVIIDACYLAETDPVNPIPASNFITSSTPATAFTSDTLRKIDMICSAKGIDKSRGAVVLGAYEAYTLLGDTQVTSILTNESKPLTNGVVANFMGFNIIVMPDNSAITSAGSFGPGSLPFDISTPTAPVRTCYYINFDAVILHQQYLQTYAYFAGTHNTDLTALDYGADAKALDPNGIIVIKCTEPAIS